MEQDQRLRLLRRLLAAFGGGWDGCAIAGAGGGCTAISRIGDVLGFPNGAGGGVTAISRIGVVRPFPNGAGGGLTLISGIGSNSGSSKSRLPEPWAGSNRCRCLGLFKISESHFPFWKPRPTNPALPQGFGNPRNSLSLLVKDDYFHQQARYFRHFAAIGGLGKLPHFTQLSPKRFM